MNSYDVYIGEAVFGNVGGWCALIERDGKGIFLKGAMPHATHRELVLVAMDEALKSLPGRCSVKINAPLKRIVYEWAFRRDWKARYEDSMLWADLLRLEDDGAKNKKEIEIVKSEESAELVMAKRAAKEELEKLKGGKDEKSES